VGDETENKEAYFIGEYKRTQSQQWLGKLYEPYMSLVYGLSLKYLKNPAEAQDMVMEVYEVLVVKLKTHEVQSFKSWLYTVSKNRCLEQLRKKSRHQTKELTAYAVYNEDVFHPDKVDKEALYLDMESCMESLSSEQKICVDAFYYQGKTYKVIAEEQDMAWNRVRSHIQNGRMQLKKCLESKKKKHV